MELSTMSHKPISAGKSSFDLIDFSAFMSALDLQGETVILDVACGIGNYAIEIARQIGKREPCMPWTCGRRGSTNSG
jgi:hypothetical protein